jgi:hypothetical protein
MYNPGSRKRVIRIFLFVCTYSRFHFLQNLVFIYLKRLQKGKSEQLLFFYE